MSNFLRYLLTYLRINVIKIHQSKVDQIFFQTLLPLKVSPKLVMNACAYLSIPFLYKNWTNRFLKVTCIKNQLLRYVFFPIDIKKKNSRISNKNVIGHLPRAGFLNFRMYFYKKSIACVSFNRTGHVFLFLFFCPGQRDKRF